MQIIRISFLDMEHGDGERIRRYIEERDGKGGGESDNAPTKSEIERRKFARTSMPQRKDAWISMQFNRNSTATATEKPIELSDKSVSITYRGDTPVSHGMEIEKVILSLPGVVIECRGRISFIVKESD